MEAIKIVVLHLEGEAYEWRFHGLYTLGHASVTSYEEFTQRLVEIFDCRNIEAHFVELAKLKKIGDTETYISEFLKLLVMVSDLSATRRVYMFIDGLAEPLHGLVKSIRPTTLQEAIERARDLKKSLPRERAPFQQNFSSQEKGKDVKVPPSKENQDKASLSDDV